MSPSDVAVMPFEIHNVCANCGEPCRSRFCAMACFVAWMRHVEAVEVAAGAQVIPLRERGQS